MGRRGPRPKPIEQKRRTGNPGGKRLPDRSELAAVAPLDRERRLWDRPPGDVVEAVLDEVPWLSVTDSVAVVMLRATVAYFHDLASDPAAKPQHVLACIREVCRQLNALGLDPSARAELGLAEVRTQSQVAEIVERKRR